MKKHRTSIKTVKYKGSIGGYVVTNFHGKKAFFLGKRDALRMFNASKRVVKKHHTKRISMKHLNPYRWRL